MLDECTLLFEGDLECFYRSGETEDFNFPAALEVIELLFLPFFDPAFLSLEFAEGCMT